MMNLKFATRLFAWMFLLVLLPLVLATFAIKSQYEQFIVNELTDTIGQSIDKSVEDVYSNFDLLSNLSSLLAGNQSLRTTLLSEQSYYEKTVAINSIYNELLAVNLFNIDRIQVTILEKNGQVYSNWSRNFNDYSFLYDEPWVQQSLGMKGHIQWIIFSDAFILNHDEGEQYVGLVRSVLSNGLSGDEVGTLIVSMRQQEFSSVLERYRYSENDCIYLCDDRGEIILRLDEFNRVTSLQDGFLPLAYYQATEKPSLGKIDGMQFLVNSYTLKYRWSLSGRALKLVHFLDYEAITSQFNKFSADMNAIMVVAAVVTLLVVFALSSLFVRPVKQLSAAMEDYQAAGTMQTLDINRRDEVGDLNRAYYQMTKNIEQLIKQLRREQGIKQEYLLNYLKAQLNPHFLFNTLGSIRWMALMQNAGNIVEAIDSLSRVLNYSMGKDVELVAVEEELDTIAEYVKIRNIRFGKIITLEVAADKTLLQLRILRFIMQPVVENSLIHGFGDKRQQGCIRIDIRREDERLSIQIEDDGQGMTHEEMACLNQALEEMEASCESHEPEAPAQESAGKIAPGTCIGVKNVHQQIRIRYGADYGVRFEQGRAGGIRVVYRLPVIRQEEGNDEEGHGG